MELLKTLCYKAFLLYFLFYLISCDDKEPIIEYNNNNYNDTLIWYEKNGTEKRTIGYIDFVNDSGFYRNHTSIIGYMPSTTTAMQVFDTTFSKKFATTMFLGYVYSTMLHRIKYYKINKQKNIEFPTVKDSYSYRFYYADEGTYLTGNNRQGGWEHLFTENFGHPEPNEAIFDFLYINDTITIYTYSKKGDTLQTDMIYFPFVKFKSLKL